MAQRRRDARGRFLPTPRLYAGTQMDEQTLTRAERITKRWMLDIAVGCLTLAAAGAWYALALVFHG